MKENIDIVKTELKEMNVSGKLLDYIENDEFLEEMESELSQIDEMILRKIVYHFVERYKNEKSNFLRRKAQYIYHVLSKKSNNYDMELDTIMKNMD